MGGRDGCEGSIICEIVNSVGQGNFTFVREFQKPLEPVFKAEGGISRTRTRKREEKEWRPSLPFACCPRPFVQVGV